MKAVDRSVYAPPFGMPIVATAGLLLTAAYVSGLLVLMETSTYDVWGAMLLGPVLIVVSLPALSRQAAREGDRALFRLLIMALLVKLAGAVARYFVTFALYGRADAIGYHEWGVTLSQQFWRGDFATGLPSLSGTGFMRFITGVTYAGIGPSKLGGFLFFSWLGFWGLFLFYRAFVEAVPGGRPGSYARLVFFLPSLVFWPSSIGKEAWMMFSLGLACFGVARLLRGRVVRGIPPMLLGLWLAAILRPHVAGMVSVAVVAAVLMKKSSPSLRQLAPAVKVASLAAVLVVAAILVVRTDEFLQEAGIETSGGVGSTLEDVNTRTSQGGSEFSASLVEDPVRAPLAVATVLFRPFITEAHNAQALVAALEGSAILAITLFHWRGIVASVRSMRDRPYLAFVLAYVGMFIVGFSSIANFGILVRQRVQLYPLFFVLLAVPPLPARLAAEARHE